VLRLTPFSLDVNIEGFLDIGIVSVAPANFSQVTHLTSLRLYVLAR
jgi:hypothetical protein